MIQRYPILTLAVAILISASVAPRAHAGALSLDGNGDIVTFPGTGIPTGSSAFTIEAWINPTSIPAGGTSGGQITFWGNEGPNGAANGFRMASNDGLNHYFWGNDHIIDPAPGGDMLADTTGPHADGWHHVAITYDSTTNSSTWYRNGAPIGTLVRPVDPNVAAANYRIGARPTGEYFHGFIDEVRVWDKARSGTEIATDFERELTGGEANLIAYFDFEGDYIDRAGGNNSGTPVGDASIDPAAGAPVGSSGGPSIQSFSATPAARYEGETSTLAWNIDVSEVTGSLVIEIVAPGGAILHTTSNATGDFGLVIGDTGGTAQTRTYTLRARETGGTMISRESTTDIAADPGIPTAGGQSLTTVTITPVAITLSGTDPNQLPNPTLAFSVVSPPSGGLLSGTAPNLTYTANGGFTGSDTFTFKTNDGKYDSPPATVTINVIPQPSPPTAITLSTTNIGENVLSGGFVATLFTSDVNVGDTHTYSLVAGAGDSNNGLFAIVGNQLRAATSFAGQVGNSYSIRLRTQDNGGLSYQTSFTLTVVMVSRAVVINEIHYNPPSNPIRQEFIELHNPSDAAADLSGWRLTSAVDFVFPNGTSIPAGGYLVIAEDPATLLATLSATALGPYLGGLSGDGETVRLRDSNDTIVDEVDYKVGFPWPVAADGGGASIELINPTLDNSLGSSWRASIPQAQLGTATLLPYADNGWSWRPGLTEASDPVGNWRQQDFTEDASWTPGVQTPIGYGVVNGVTLNTMISGMMNTYNCLFLRHSFDIAPGEIPSQLVLNFTADDGIVVWINGVEVERRRFLAAEATTIDGLATANSTEGAYENKTLINPGAFLVEGTNTIAVQLFNFSRGSSDLGFDLEIVRPAQEAPLPQPSPGARNTAFASNAAPNIRKVDHTPEQPRAADPVVITAKITDPEGVGAVSVEYQVVAPGAYVPAQLPHPVPNIPTTIERPDNPAYETGWVSVTMVDDGTGGDALAGDDLFTATLPAQTHRTLVRYRISITDGLGKSARVPYSDDPSLNFAYFVYDGVPAYQGNSAAVMAGTLPVYHLLTRAEDYSKCIAYNPADQIPQGGLARFFYNWNGTIVYDGIVYDNIRYRLRGANGRYQSAGKRSMRFRLNDGRHLQARDITGKKYAQKWRTLTLGKCSSNRLTLTFGLNEAINFHLFNQVGVPAADAQWLQWRVIDGADEAPDASHGDFHGFYLVAETYDVSFLEEHKLEKGNLYKLINQTTDWAQQQRYQAAFAPTDGSDHNAIENNLDGAKSADYIRANVNLDKWNRSHALVQAIRHYDYWPSANKNMVYYFEPDYLPANNNNGKLWILPWDTDATWGPTYNAGHDVVYNALFSSNQPGGDTNSTPELWPAYFNEVRQIRDLLWQTDQINPLIDAFAATIAPLEAADASRWKGTPADAGNYSGLHGPGLTSLAAYVQDMKNFAFTGGVWDGGNVGAGGQAAFLDTLQASSGEGGQIPATPIIAYAGTAGFPTNGLAFQSNAFSDPQGNGTFAAMEWRIAQITDPTAPSHDPTARFKLEWEANWESGAIPSFASTIDIPTVAVRSGLTYRARVRHQDTSGRWSHWSAPLQFTTTLPDISAYRNGLVISEVMYHPTDPSAAEINAGFTNDNVFEYIELRNVGPVPLDLTDVRFTKGVDFDFLGADITSLAPGAFVLVVANRAAFEMRYGPGLPVAGEWQSTDSLSNGGEQLKLSFGAGDALRDFVYDDASPWPTNPDGGGPSLTLGNPMSVPDHALAASWRASYVTGGTPGVDDPGETYGSWRDAKFGPGSPPLSGELDDADGDGLVNVLEYVLVSDPLNSGSTPAVMASLEDIGGTRYLTLTYTRLLAATDAVFEVEVSTDLALWNSGPSFVTQAFPPIDHGNGTLTISQRSLIPSGSIPRESIHLRVTLNP